MSPPDVISTPPSREGEPVWGVAELFPEQGAWLEDDYLALKTNRLVEFDQGTIEILPMPTRTHQLIVLYLFMVLKTLLDQRGRQNDTLLVAPYKLRIPGGKYREPDLLYMTPEQNSAASEVAAVTGSLVIEVVSPDDPNRDYIVKRADYAAAAVREYWIVDRSAWQVTVLTLEGAAYRELGVFGRGDRVASLVFPQMQLNVDAVMSH